MRAPEQRIRNKKNGAYHTRTALILLCTFCLIMLLPASSSPAENATRDIEAQREEYKKLQKDIEAQHEKVETAKKHEHSILEELDRTNMDLTRVQAELGRYREKLRATERDIRKVEADISANKAKLDKQREWLKRKLRIMQRHGYSGDVMLLLSTSEDISQLMRRWRYIKSIALHDHEMLEDHKKTLDNLDEQENRLKSLRARLQETEEDIEVNAAELSEKKKEKETLLSSVRKEKSSYEKMLKEMREASRKLQEIIRRSGETETYFGKGFHGQKGRLSWPVNGRVTVPYGSQKDPKFKTPVFRNGIHISTENDSSARAVYGGKVVFAEWFKGYGQLVIINHGEGYHTLYANLSEIFYKVGDIIKEDAVIGKVGESGTSSGPGLYFEVRYKGKPLDPMQWLKKR